MIRNLCAICSNTLENIYERPNIPITLACVDSAKDYICDTMSFSECIQCKTIQLDRLIPIHLLYQNSHNTTSVGKTWEIFFDTFAQKIQPHVSQKTVLEIGCPSGKIARKCSDYNTWYIVDPNKNTNANFGENIVFIEAFFDENFHTDAKINTIVHSHLFEHIYDPNAFLSTCNKLLDDDGDMIFAVPNMEEMTDKTLFLGIFFEHTIFLNKTNITYLLHKHGFEIVDIIDYEKHSTIYHTKRRTRVNNCVPTRTLQLNSYRDVFFKLVNETVAFVNKCNGYINNYNDRPIFIFGASYNTQLLLFFGINQEKLTGILDNCPDKHFQYLYGTQLKIYSPDFLKTHTNAVVILKNGYYTTEIFKQLTEINSNSIIIM